MAGRAGFRVRCASAVRGGEIAHLGSRADRMHPSVPGASGVVGARSSFVPVAALLLAALAACASGGGGSSPRAADAQRAARLASAGPFTLAGAWTGFLMNGMQLVRVDIELGATPTLEDGVEVHAGEATLAEIGLPGSATQRAGTPVSADARLEHDPATGTFTLAFPRARGGDPRQLTRRFRNIVGVTDPAHHRLAGFHGNALRSADQLFRFTRPEEVDATLATFARFAGRGPVVKPKQQSRLGGQRPSLGELFGGADTPDPRVVLDWAAGIDAAYDSFRKPRRSTTVTHTDALLLLADEPFAVAFGAPFDGLSDDAVDGIHALLKGEFLYSSDPAEKGVAGLAGLFKRGDQGAPNGLQTLNGVLALRTLRAWLDERTARMESAPVGAAGFATVTGMEVALGDSPLGVFAPTDAPLAAAFWPSEREAALAVADRAHDRQAYGALERSLDELEQFPHTQETWDVVFDWISTEAAEFTRVSQAEREVLGARRGALLDAVMATLLEPDLAARPAHRTDDVAWIADEVLWWHRLRHDHARAWLFQDGVLAELKGAFLAERAAALDAAIPALGSTIAGLRLARLPDVEAVWFSLPGDDETAAAAAARRAVDARRRVIDAAIAAAEQDARAVVDADPSRPLPFLDVRRYAAPGFVRLVYFGEVDGPDGMELLEAWDAGDLQRLMSTRNTLMRFRAAFRIHHGTAYREHFREAADREAWRLATGEDWTGIRSDLVTTDQWGNELNRVEGQVHTHVRTTYAQTYNACEESEADLWGSLWLGSMAANEAAKRGGHPFDPSTLEFEDPTDTEVSILDAALATREEYAATAETFLADHLDAHPATVRWFERNLHALVTGGRLERLERPEVDGL